LSFKLQNFRIMKKQIIIITDYVLMILNKSNMSNKFTNEIIRIDMMRKVRKNSCNSFTLDCLMSGSS